MLRVVSKRHGGSFSVPTCLLSLTEAATALYVFLYACESFHRLAVAGASSQSYQLTLSLNGMFDGSLA